MKKNEGKPLNIRLLISYLVTKQGKGVERMCML